MENFKTEQEAQDRVDEINSKGPGEFCPLIRETCRADCICHDKASVHESVSLNGAMERVKSFRVIVGGCSNAMLFEY